MSRTEELELDVKWTKAFVGSYRMDLERAERQLAKTEFGPYAYDELLKADTTQADLDQDQQRTVRQVEGPALVDRCWVGIYLRAQADKRWNEYDRFEERTWTLYWASHLQKHIDDEIAYRIKRAK